MRTLPYCDPAPRRMFTRLPFVRAHWRECLPAAPPDLDWRPVCRLGHPPLADRRTKSAISRPRPSGFAHVASPAGVDTLVWRTVVPFAVSNQSKSYEPAVKPFTPIGAEHA